MKMQTDSERLTLAADDAATAAYYAYVTAVESLTNAHATRNRNNSNNDDEDLIIGLLS